MRPTFCPMVIWLISLSAAECALEAAGCLWASGPLPSLGGVLVGEGLTILSTCTIEDKRKAMERGAAHQASARQVRTQKIRQRGRPAGACAAISSQRS